MSEAKHKKDEYQKALTVYGQAVKEFQKGNYEKATDSFVSFIEKYPGEREVVDRAQIYLAIIQKRSKHEGFPLKSIDDYCHAAAFKINQGDFEGASKILEKALNLKEKEGHVHYLMAAAFCRMGQMDNALDHLKKAIQKDKGFSTLAQNEPDFKSAWEDKKFKLITRLA